MIRSSSVCFAALAAVLSACQPGADTPSATSAAASAQPLFVGGQVCATCHAEQARSWQGSHHQQAMEPASPDTVRGDFADAEFSHNGVVTRFFTRDGGYWVNTDDADGRPRDF